MTQKLLPCIVVFLCKVLCIVWKVLSSISFAQNSTILFLSRQQKLKVDLKTSHTKNERNLTIMKQKYIKFHMKFNGYCLKNSVMNRLNLLYTKVLPILHQAETKLSQKCKQEHQRWRKEVIFFHWSFLLLKYCSVKTLQQLIFTEKN